MRKTALTRLLAGPVVAALVACSQSSDLPEDAVELQEEASDGLDRVYLDSAAFAMAGIELGNADTVRSAGLPATGSISYDQNRVSHIGPRTEGRIVALNVDLGARVRRGDVMAVLESPEVGATRADLHEAEALVKIARENHEREKRLETQGISSRKELLVAEAELRRAEASFLRATERLQAMGAEHGEGGQFAVVAPFDGVVAEKHATRGEVVGPADQLFTFADLGRLWIELDIYERDLRRVSVDQPVSVTTAAYNDRTFDGRIVYIGDILDPARRTVRARVEVDNADALLKPGMFARADIRVSSGEAVVVVPREAVQDVEGKQIVWAPGVAPGEFVAMPVETGRTIEDGRIEILAGLSAGDRLVTRGAFTLKAELSKGEFAGHGH